MAREAAGGKNVVIFGATVARECLEAGLVDEVMVHVVPILLGSGVRLYASLQSVDLETIDTSQTGPIAMLRYRVVR
jgi:dihydrofolate reductase